MPLQITVSYEGVPVARAALDADQTAVDLTLPPLTGSVVEGSIDVTSDGEEVLASASASCISEWLRCGTPSAEGTTATIPITLDSTAAYGSLDQEFQGTVYVTAEGRLLRVTVRIPTLRPADATQPSAIAEKPPAPPAETVLVPASDERELERLASGAEATEIRCPKCGRHMMITPSRHGKFLVCSGFPECRHTMPLEETIESPAPPSVVAPPPVMPGPAPPWAVAPPSVQMPGMPPPPPAPPPQGYPPLPGAPPQYPAPPQAYPPGVIPPYASSTAVPGVCRNHPNVETAAACAWCRNPFCDQCLVEFRGSMLCAWCKQNSLSQMQRVSTTVNPQTVMLWARVYDVVMVISSLVLVGIAFAMAGFGMSAGFGGTPDFFSVWSLIRIVPAFLAVIMGLVPAVALARGRRWAYIWQMIILIPSVLLSCFWGGCFTLPLWPAAIALFVFWIKPEVRDYFEVH